MPIPAGAEIRVGLDGSIEVVIPVDTVDWNGDEDADIILERVTANDLWAPEE